MTRRLAWVGVALSTLAILVATLHASGADLPPGWSFDLTSGPSALAELFQNLLLFIPLGASLTLAGVRPVPAVAIGAALTCSVEFAQQWIPGRDPSTGDIICNTVSTGLGVALVLDAPRWLHATPHRAARLALGVASAAVLVWLGTGSVVHPILPQPPYHDDWTPDYPAWGHYEGKVVAASQFTPGQPLQVTAVAPDRPPDYVSPLIAILDRHDARVLTLSVDRTDLVAEYLTKGGELTLEQPDLRLRGALARIAPQDTFVAQTWRDASGICLALNALRRCGYGFTIGDGWKLIYYPRHFPAWLYALLNLLWVAGWTIGVGWWGRKAVSEAAAIPAAATALVLLGLALVPLLTGLKPTPIIEWLGAVAGLAGGYLLAHVRRTM